MNFGDGLTVALTLFAVRDILGSIPIIISLRSNIYYCECQIQHL